MKLIQDIEPNIEKTTEVVNALTKAAYSLSKASIKMKKVLHTIIMFGTASVSVQFVYGICINMNY